MKMETINIDVSPQLATAYRTASEEDRRRLGLLVSLQLTEFLKSADSLEDAMQDMSQEAAAAGLTPDMLQSIIHGA